MTISNKRKRRFKLKYIYKNRSSIMWNSYRVTGQQIDNILRR